MVRQSRRSRRSRRSEAGEGGASGCHAGLEFRVGGFPEGDEDPVGLAGRRGVAARRGNPAAQFFRFRPAREADDGVARRRDVPYRAVEVARGEVLARLHDAVEALADVLYADEQDDEPDDLFRLTERAI